MLARRPTPAGGHSRRPLAGRRQCAVPGKCHRPIVRAAAIPSCGSRTARRRAHGVA